MSHLISTGRLLAFASTVGLLASLSGCSPEPVSMFSVESVGGTAVSVHVVNADDDADGVAHITVTEDSGLTVRSQLSDGGQVSFAMVPEQSAGEGDEQERTREWVVSSRDEIDVEADPGEYELRITATDGTTGDVSVICEKWPAGTGDGQA